MLLFLLLESNSLFCCSYTCRVLGALRFHPNLAVLTNTLAKSLRNFGPFFFIFMITLAAFVTSGCILFGESLEQYSTISKSIVTCINMLFGQFDYSAIQGVDYNVALVWYWLAMIVLFLVLFNMLLAIVIDAYSEVKEANAGHSRSVLREFKIIANDLFQVKSLFGRDSHSKLKKEITAGAFEKMPQQLTVKDVSAKLGIKNKYARQLIRTTKVLAYATNEEPEPQTQVTSPMTIEHLHDKMVRIEDRLSLLIEKLSPPNLHTSA